MIEIIPAIDIIDGKCVRLSQGDYDSKKVYNENPVEVAKEFEANGVRRLHVVDSGRCCFSSCSQLSGVGTDCCAHFSRYRFWWWSKE